MSPNQSILAHRDVKDALDRALSNGRGVRIRCDTYGETINLRQRCYNLRQIDRNMNAKLYPVDDPMHGRSVYDAVILRPMEYGGQFYLVAEVSNPQRLADRIEDLAPVVPPKDAIREAIRECNVEGISDADYWEAVHSKLRLPYGELFPILEEDPSLQETTE